MRRLVRSFAATPAGSWLFARIAQRLDDPVLRATRGRMTLSSLLAGLPVVVLTTTGARSGLSRSVPLVGLPVTPGQATAPSHATAPGQATAVEGEQREAIWRRALEIYPGYADYARRAAHRDILVWVLEPIAA